jgi:cytochrome o ubiquinol oxidase subunit 2
MRKRFLIACPLLGILVVALVVAWLVSGGTFSVLDPRGLIAYKERQLIVITTALMLIVVIPVYVLTFFFAWKYRAGNKTAS